MRWMRLFDLYFDYNPETVKKMREKLLEKGSGI